MQHCQRIDRASARRGDSQEIDSLTAQVRVALRKTIIQEVFGAAAEPQVITLDPKLEQLLLQTLSDNGNDGFAMEPRLAQRMQQAAVNLEVAR